MFLVSDVTEVMVSWHQKGLKPHRCRLLTRTWSLHSGWTQK